MGCSPFEEHVGRKPNNVCLTVANGASSSNLIWRNVLYSLDRNKKMFLARVIQENASPNDKSKKGMCYRVERPLAE